MPQNFLDMPRLDQQRQAVQINALNMRNVEEDRELRQDARSEEERLANTKWLAAVGQFGVEQMQQDPNSYVRLMPEIEKEGQRRGIWEKIGIDYTVASPEAILEGFQEMTRRGQVALAGMEQDKIGKGDLVSVQTSEGPRYSTARDAIGLEPGSSSLKDPSIPAKIQQAEWWMSANPEQRKGYMSANYAGSVKDINGVPTWVFPGGEKMPLTTLEDEKAAAAELALSEGEGSRGRIQQPTGEFEAVPGSEADVKQKEAERKRAGGAFMKSIQSQTVVDDVARLNEQINAGKVPFGRVAAIQKNLHPSMQTDGYRNANSLIESVKGNVGIDSLLRIKATGAGLGQVPQSQLDLLSRLLGELDMNQSKEQFVYTWNRMGAVYEIIMKQADEDLYDLDVARPEVSGTGGGITPTGRTATNPETGQQMREMSDGSWQ